MTSSKFDSVFAQEPVARLVQPAEPSVADHLPVYISARIPAGLRRRFRIACLRADREVQDVIQELIAGWVSGQAS